MIDKIVRTPNINMKIYHQSGRNKYLSITKSHTHQNLMNHTTVSQ